MHHQVAGFILHKRSENDNYSTSSNGWVNCRLHKELARKLDDLEMKYDQQFQVVFEAIRQLMDLPARYSTVSLRRHSA